MHVEQTLWVGDEETETDQRDRDEERERCDVLKRGIRAGLWWHLVAQRTEHYLGYRTIVMIALLARESDSIDG
jgi:hypothetical protein